MCSLFALCRFLSSRDDGTSTMTHKERSLLRSFELSTLVNFRIIYARSLYDVIVDSQDISTLCVGSSYISTGL